MIGGSPAQIHIAEGDMCYGAGGQGPVHPFYNDLEPEEADKWSAMLKPQLWPLYNCKTPVPELKVPMFYLHTTNDDVLPLAMQQQIVEQARAAGASVRTETCNVGHSPFLKIPEKTGIFIRRAAGQPIASPFSQLV